MTIQQALDILTGKTPATLAEKLQAINILKSKSLGGEND